MQSLYRLLWYNTESKNSVGKFFIADIYMKIFEDNVVHIVDKYFFTDICKIS